MAGYFGTDNQRRLQMLAEKSNRFGAATPGACQAGRMLGCDDPDRLGWEHIDGLLARDGVLGFRLIDTAKVEGLKAHLSERRCRLDTWDVFLADRASALAAVDDITMQSLPSGLRQLASSMLPEEDQMVRVQTMMADAGLVPFSGSMLAGELGPTALVVIGDAVGNIVASAFGYMPHNAHSRYKDYAWGGLVAVSEPLRGKGLGKIVNALMIKKIFDDLNASHVYELVSADNIASRRMVEACGLRPDQTLTCGIATPQVSSRFTK
jgi:RimJ/RimL family protein N-acetyltransferase